MNSKDKELLEDFKAIVKRQRYELKKRNRPLTAQKPVLEKLKVMLNELHRLVEDEKSTV